MTEDDFEDYMATIDGTMTYDYFSNNKNSPIQMGDITIPADKNVFNKMWLDKAFDKIDPSLFIKINPAAFVNAGGDQVICEGSFVTLNGK